MRGFITESWNGLGWQGPYNDLVPALLYEQNQANTDFPACFGRLQGLGCCQLLSLGTHVARPSLASKASQELTFCHMTAFHVPSALMNGSEGVTQPCPEIIPS